MEHLHRRSVEIKEILQSSETPLELQVSLPEFKHTCTHMLISCTTYCRQLHKLSATHYIYDIYKYAVFLFLR